MTCRVILLGFGLVFSLIDAAFAGESVILPEPASMALFATGVGALAIYRMRRRK
jgi:hypothetical protein